MQWRRLQALVQPGYTGTESAYLVRLEGVSHNTAETGLTAIVGKMLATNLFHAANKLFESGGLPLDGLVENERVIRLSLIQLAALWLIYPEYDIKHASDFLIIARPSVINSLTDARKTLGVHNLTQLAPYSFYVHQTYEPPAFDSGGKLYIR